MKKLILSVAILLGSYTAFAQTSTTTKTATTTQTVEDKYTEIKTENLPGALVSALKSAQPEAVIEKAYINDKKEYKLDIKTGDKRSTVYADASGNLIQK